jgi:hypothetical protein
MGQFHQIPPEFLRSVRVLFARKRRNCGADYFQFTEAFLGLDALYLFSEYQKPAVGLGY